MSFLATPTRDTLRATILTLIAGIADAVGYITMGGVFAANMTGNTVLAGIAAAQRNYTDAWHHLAPLLAFFLGAMLSRLLLRLSHKPTAGLLVEAALLAVVGFLPIGPEPAVLILAVAMGVQASAITHFSGNAVSTVVVTSTLARTADTAARPAVARREESPCLSSPTCRCWRSPGSAISRAPWPARCCSAAMPYPLLVPVALLGLLLFL